MDFQSLSRRELQALCKKNKIPANMTNVAMANALQALTDVEGIDDIKSLLSEQSALKTPATSRRARQTAPVLIENELEGSQLAATRARRGARQKNDHEEEGEKNGVKDLNSQIPGTPAVRPSQRRGAATSNRKKIEICSDEGNNEGEKKDANQSTLAIIKTPTVQTGRKRATGTSIRKKIEINVEGNDGEEKENVVSTRRYCTRRSARLMSDVKPSDTISKRGGARPGVIKISALSEEKSEDLVKDSASDVEGGIDKDLNVEATDNPAMSEVDDNPAMSEVESEDLTNTLISEVKDGIENEFNVTEELGDKVTNVDEHSTLEINHIPESEDSVVESLVVDQYMVEEDSSPVETQGEEFVHENSNDKQGDVILANESVLESSNVSPSIVVSADVSSNGTAESLLDMVDFVPEQTIMENTENSKGEEMMEASDYNGDASAANDNGRENAKVLVSESAEECESFDESNEVLRKVEDSECMNDSIQEAAKSPTSIICNPDAALDGELSENAELLLVDSSSEDVTVLHLEAEKVVTDEPLENQTMVMEKSGPVADHDMVLPSDVPVTNESFSEGLKLEVGDLCPIATEHLNSEADEMGESYDAEFSDYEDNEKTTEGADGILELHSPHVGLVEEVYSSASVCVTPNRVSALDSEFQSKVTPLKSSSKKPMPITMLAFKVFDDNKEGNSVTTALKSRVAVTDEKENNGINSGDNTAQKVLKNASLRQLRKMFKEKLTIADNTNHNKTYNDAKEKLQSEKTRPALKNLADNCLVGGGEN